MIEMSYPMTPDEGVFWQTIISGVSAFLTLIAIVAAIWVGQEPRRLASEARLQRAKSLARALAGEVEIGAARVLGVCDALDPYDDEDVISAKQLTLIYHYLRRAQFPLLSRLIGDLYTFDEQLAAKLALLYANEARIQVMCGPDGDIQAVDLGDVNVSDIRPTAKSFYASIVECLRGLHDVFGQPYDDGPVKSAAQFITQTIHVQ